MAVNGWQVLRRQALEGEAPAEPDTGSCAAPVRITGRFALPYSRRYEPADFDTLPQRARSARCTLPVGLRGGAEKVSGLRK